MRSSTNPVPKHSSKQNSYSPGVPLSVYRELAADLQAAQAMLNSLNAQNQQLAIQNQQLRQEIEKVVQYVMHLQQVVDAIPVHPVDGYHSNRQSKLRSSRPVSSPRFIHQGSYQHSKASVATSKASENRFTQVEEVEQDGYRRRFQAESASGISGGRLLIAILLVIFTAFGAGYFLVRPLLSNR